MKTVKNTPEWMKWFKPSEREKWASPFALSNTQQHVGLPMLDARSRELYETALPRGVLLPRFTPERPRVNYWMPPHQLMEHAYVPGQIILGKFAGRFLGHLDDRPMVTIAGARAGKTSTILEPNLYLYPGSMLVLDPKGELARTARLRRALLNNVYVLDPFGQSGEPSACFNALGELFPDSPTIIDDVASITQALIVDDGDARSRHWNDNARTLLQGIILLTLMLPESERNLSPSASCFPSPTHACSRRSLPREPRRTIRSTSNSTMRTRLPFKRFCAP